jgi:hypothetical protein
LSIDVPDIVSSFPTGICWPLVGDIILTALGEAGDDGDCDGICGGVFDDDGRGICC